MAYNPSTLFHKTERITLTLSKTRTIRNATHFHHFSYKWISISIVITDLMQICDHKSALLSTICGMHLPETV